MCTWYSISSTGILAERIWLSQSTPFVHCVGNMLLVQYCPQVCHINLEKCVTTYIHVVYCLIVCTVAVCKCISLLKGMQILIYCHSCRTVLCRNQFCQLVSLVLRLFWLILWQVFLYMFIVRTFQVVFCSVHTMIHVLQLHQLRSHCSMVTEKTDLQPKHTTKVCIMTSCRHSPVGPSLLRTSVAYTQFTPPGQADKTVMSVSCLPRRCELDSQLETVADRKCEVWAR